MNQVEVKFDDFNKLFVFLHLEPVYKNLAWVIVDGGNQEKEVIENLKKNYVRSGWQEDRFLQFTEHDFERYYPKEFQLEVDEILLMHHGRAKQARKKALLDDVESWIGLNCEEAKVAFEESASEVIGILRCIALSINSTIK